MRIVSGIYRRRKLLTNPGLTTRPITDRAKVMLFDWLEPRWRGARVLDVFAGTGTMGFEALSRGALSVVFVEQDRRAHQLLCENAHMLGAEEALLSWRTDALLCSFRPKGERPWGPFSIIFFDPPFAIANQMRPGAKMYRALERLTRPDVSTPDALLIVRTPVEQLADLPPAWAESIHHLNLGAMRIDIRRKQAQLAAPAQDADEELPDAESPLRPI